MVTKLYEEPADVADRYFEELAEEDDTLKPKRRRNTAHLERGSGFASTTDTVLIAHPEKGGMNLEPPYYCLTTHDAEYVEDAWAVAEAIEQAFDLEVYLFRGEE